MRIGAFLPFCATYYLNGHVIIARMLDAQGVRFLSCACRCRGKRSVNERIADAQAENLNVHIEKRHRHLKCFWDLAELTSPCFDRVVNQIVFIALTYSLLQILKQARKALKKASKSRLMEELTPVYDAVIVYTGHYYAVFDKLEYTDMVP